MIHSIKADYVFSQIKPLGRLAASTYLWEVTPPDFFQLLWLTPLEQRVHIPTGFIASHQLAESVQVQLTLET